MCVCVCVWVCSCVRVCVVFCLCVSCAPTSSTKLTHTNPKRMFGPNFAAYRKQQAKKTVRQDHYCRSFRSKNTLTLNFSYLVVHFQKYISYPAKKNGEKIWTNFLKELSDVLMQASGTNSRDQIKLQVSVCKILFYSFFWTTNCENLTATLQVTRMTTSAVHRANRSEIMFFL